MPAGSSQRRRTPPAVPAPRSGPSSRKTIRSHTSRAKPISCVTTTIVIPPRASSRMTSSTSRIISGSSAEVGSSKSMSLGSIARARAIATRCCWPPERSAGEASAFSGMPTVCSSSRARACAAAGSTPLTFTGARVMFSSTVLCGKRLNCWKTMPMSARMRPIDFERGSTGRPSKRTLPASTGSRPLMHRSIVDLPEPDGPATTTASPGAIARSMSSSTRLSPKLLRTPLSSTSGAASALFAITADYGSSSAAGDASGARFRTARSCVPGAASAASSAARCSAARSRP